MAVIQARLYNELTRVLKEEKKREICDELLKLALFVCLSNYYAVKYTLCIYTERIREIRSVSYTYNFNSYL